GGNAVATFDLGLDEDIESVARRKRQLAAHRGVSDRVLTDELRIARLVALVEADRSGRKGVAEPAVAARRESYLALHVDRLRIGRQPSHGAAVDLARGHALHVEEADLLGLVVGDRGALI